MYVVFFSQMCSTLHVSVPDCPDVCASLRHQVAASALHGEEEEEEVSRPGTLTPWRSCLWMKLPVSDLLRQFSTYLSFSV